MADVPANLVRLNKYLADNGIASRRACDQLIAEGEVMVDGEIVTELGTKVDPTTQRVEVDGVVLRPEGERLRYYLLNKPTGVICTNDPREGRRRAVDLIADRKKGRIYTVGRLDEDSSGLVVLTNDGDLANLVGHPRYGVSKTYKVVVQGRIDEEALHAVRAGVRLSEGRADFERVTIKGRSERQSSLLVVLKQGRNRQIRRVFARVGYKVISLARVRIADLTDRGLKVGHWRPLTRDEVNMLRGVARGEIEEGASRPRRRKAGGGPARRKKSSRGTSRGSDRKGSNGSRGRTKD